MLKRLTGWTMVLGVLVSLAGASAQESDVGPVTGRPLPRYISLKVSNGNVRRGPSQAQRIDWVFTRKGTPLLVTAEFEHWRRVRDEDGAGGWMHYALLSGHRTIVVRTKRVALRKEPNDSAGVVALVEKGVIASLSSCEPAWCKIDIENVSGWIQKSDIWGVGPSEILE